MALAGSQHTPTKPEVLSVLTRQDIARFWVKVGRDGTTPAHATELGPCWPWASSTNNRGYGQFGVVAPGGGPRKQLTFYAHRIAWSLSNGPIPDGKFALHHCDNPPCCNPSHVYIGDHKQNMADAKARGRMRPPPPRALRITNAEWLEMLAMADAGMTNTAIALEFGVTKQYVGHLLNGKSRHYSLPALRVAS